MPLTLAYNEYGNGPPLIVLHGLFGSARNWHSLANRWGQQQHVYAVDLRNHGSSPWGDTMDYPAMAEDLAEFIERHHLDRPTILGHSMGGKATMTLALNHGEQVGAIIIVDIAPVAYNHEHLGYIEAMLALDVEHIQRRAAADAALARSIPEDGIRMFLMQNLKQSGDHFDWRINLSALAANMHHIVGWPSDLLEKSFAGPSLFLHGELSQYVQPSHHQRIRQLFPSAVIEAIQDAGHWVHADKPQALSQRVADFLATLA